MSFAVFFWPKTYEAWARLQQQQSKTNVPQQAMVLRRMRQNSPRSQQNNIYFYRDLVNYVLTGRNFQTCLQYEFVEHMGDP